MESGTRYKDMNDTGELVAHGMLRVGHGKVKSKIKYHLTDALVDIMTV